MSEKFPPSSPGKPVEDLLTPDVFEVGLQKMREGGAAKAAAARIEMAHEESEHTLTKKFSELLASEIKLETPANLRPSFAILSDSLYVEDRQIMLTDAEDLDEVQIDFILTEAGFKEAYARVASDESFSSDRFIFHPKNDEESTLYAGNNLKSTVLEGVTLELSVESLSDEYDKAHVAAMDRAVRISVPRSQCDVADAASIVRAVESVCEEKLGISAPFKPLSPEALSRFMQTRYVKHHYVDPAMANGAQSQLELQPWVGGTYDVAEVGVHHEYKEKYGSFAVYWTLATRHGELPTALVGMVQAGGCFSGLERTRRGLFNNQTTLGEDMRSGGARSFFTRTVTERGLAGEPESLPVLAPLVVFDPSVYDSTGFTTSLYDTWGRTGHSAHISPDEFLSQMARKQMPGNEQMFARGIPLGKIKAFVFPNEEAHERAVLMFEQEGVGEVNGIPIADFCVVANSMQAVIDLPDR
jgi:hypothetical protein